MFVVCVEFVPTPNHTETLTQLVLHQANLSLAREPDCLTFDVCRSDEDGDRIFLYERYRSRAAFDEHLQSKHFLDFDQKAQPITTEKNVSFWQQLEVLP